MDKKKLKIRFFHPDLGIGGAERLILDIAGVLQTKEHHDVSFLTNHCDKNHAFDEIKLERFSVEVRGDWIPRSIFGMFQALCAYIRMIYLAIVYVFFSNNSQDDLYFVDQIPIAIPILKRTNKKIVYYCHHPDLLASPSGGFLKKLYRKPIDWMECKCTAQADVILVNSKYTASVFRETFPQIAKEIDILYPTISQSFLSMERENTKSIVNIIPEITNYKREDVIFLSINRFHPAKNLQLAINAMEVLCDRLPLEQFNRIYLVMAGGYDPNSPVNARYFAQLQTQVHEKNLQNRIVFVKSPSEKSKLDLLMVCDCLLYTPMKEHFGIVPLEAMMCSKPVIACNSGGPRETVDHRVSGYLCNGTPESLAEYMEKMLDKELANCMGKEGTKRLDEMFSYDKFAKGVKNVVSNVSSVK